MGKGKGKEKGGQRYNANILDVVRMSSSAFVCMAGKLCAGVEGGRGKERDRELPKAFQSVIVLSGASWNLLARSGTYCRCLESSRAFQRIARAFWNRDEPSGAYF